MPKGPPFIKEPTRKKPKEKEEDPQKYRIETRVKKGPRNQVGK